MSAPALNLLLDDLEDAGKLSDPVAVIEKFAKWASSGGRELYPHQEAAALAIASGDHVIAATPTGSGKSMVALAGHLLALSRGETSYYTAPLKALVSEKFFDLVDLFGAENVGMVTGDVSLNAGAPIICCTAEILANQALRDGPETDAGLVVMDEFHFYGDHQRGWAWQVPLLELTGTQFVLMSATLGDVSFFVKDLTARTKRPVSVIDDAPRPVPLEFSYTYDDTADLIERLMKAGRWPIYLVHFAQKDATDRALALAGTSTVPRAQREKVASAIAGFNFGKGFGKTLKNLLRAGIGLHHAGMLPRYRRLVEKLTQEGLLVAVCGTDTLGVGINVPIRTVVITSLTKYDGRRSRHLSAREFHQIAGRAGRAGFDTSGFVEVQAPPHEIENEKARAKAEGFTNKKKRGGKAKLKSAPAGFVSWTEATYERLKNAAPEALHSQFQFTHAMVLNVLEGNRNFAQHLVWLARNNHDPQRERNPHLRTLGQIYASLIQSEVAKLVPAPQAGRKGVLQLAKDLPDGFALNQELSPFALAATQLLDPDSETYALDILSLVESTLEDPRPVLYAQRALARATAMQSMKAAGLEYDERMEKLEEISWPTPLADLIEGAFATFRQSNPWVSGLQPSPKSVVRDMVENADTFSSFVQRLDLTRSEGVLLRYLTDAYRALTQVVPEMARTAEFTAITEWLGNLVRAVDSSLLAEWEGLESGRPRQITPGGEETAFGADEDGNVNFSKNRHAFRRALRNATFNIVELFAADNLQALVGLGAPGWNEEKWEDALDAYFSEHDWLDTSGRARSGEHFRLLEAPTQADLADFGIDLESDLAERLRAGKMWLIEQTLVDPDENLDWRMHLITDLEASTQDAVVWPISVFRL
ncbi:MAG: DUF3516 domain-containing protein [Actinomycetaceae bacterium]|nr:DUF3516 domain-containing protein [Actinomycetaceae bacterium]